MQNALQNKISQNPVDQNDINDIIIQRKKGTNIIDDKEFISLINGLNDSIKNYFKVCKLNILENISIIKYYEEHNNSLEKSIYNILNSEKNQNINELFIEKFKQINEYINQLKINNNFSKKNLDFFFEEAKVFFKKMKIKRNQKLVEIDNIDFSNYNNSINSLKIKNFKTFLFSIKNNYSKILGLLDKLNQFNYIINGIDTKITSDFADLQKNIKNELDLFINIIIKNINNSNFFTYTYQVDLNPLLQNDFFNGKRSKSLSNQYSKKKEKILTLNRKRENEIKELTNQINIYKKKLNDTEVTLNKKILILENIIKEKNSVILSLNNKRSFNSKRSDTSSLNLNNILNQKDEQISELEKEINFGQKKENIENNQIKDLMESLLMKTKKYENQINIMTIKINQINRSIDDKNREILKLKNENSSYRQKEKVNHEKNKEFLKQIEELNNDILNSNRIIEEKDKIIRFLNIKKNDSNSQNKKTTESIYNEINNNEKNNIKKENENKKVLEKKNNKNLLKQNINNNNNNDIKQLQELNIQLYEENNLIQKQNIDSIEKIKQLTLKNKQINETYISKKNSVTLLELDISKKNEEIEGLKTVIFKLQSQLETKDDNINYLKKKSFNQSKLLIEKGALSNEIWRKSKSAIKERNSNLSKNFFDYQTEPNTEKIKELLNKLNESENQIKILQNKNKELQFKLEEKQIKDELQNFRTEDNNFSKYEEEYDLRKIVSGAKDKNKSEDINIDYPGIQAIKERYKELLQNFNMLGEQVKILILHININNKIRPHIRQICQLLGIPAHNIELIFAGKNKKNALGLMD